MAFTALEVLNEALGLLNDPNGAAYPSVAMYPLINKAYRELQNKLTSYGIGTTKETSSIVNVVAGTVKLSDGAGLPPDLIQPFELSERVMGSGTEVPWAGMDQTDFDPINLAPHTSLSFWSWREDEIKFSAATTNREVLIRYTKSLGGVTGAASPILVINSQQWLGQRTAIIAARAIGANPRRADELAGDIIEVWSDLIGPMVKRKQSIPVRRRRTKFRIN